MQTWSNLRFSSVSFTLPPTNQDSFITVAYGRLRKRDQAYDYQGETLQRFGPQFGVLLNGSPMTAVRYNLAAVLMLGKGSEYRPTTRNGCDCQLQAAQLCHSRDSFSSHEVQCGSNPLIGSQAVTSRLVMRTIGGRNEAAGLALLDDRQGMRMVERRDRTFHGFWMCWQRLSSAIVLCKATIWIFPADRAMALTVNIAAHFQLFATRGVIFLLFYSYLSLTQLLSRFD